MWEILSDLTVQTLLIACLGILLGAFFGALPGLGGSSGMAILLPLAITMSPLDSMVFLLSVYGGVNYGGGVPSVLVGVPGEAGAAATVIDGFQMTRKGKASEALAMVAMGSALAGAVSILAFLFLSPPLARMALSFGPPDLFMLVLFGLTILAAIDLEQMRKALFAGALGLAIGTVGLDGYWGEERMVFGVTRLYDGFPLVPAMIGIFCMSQMFALIDDKTLVVDEKPATPNLAGTLRGMLDTFRYWKSLVVGTVIGIVIGILPGAGAAIASFVGYTGAKLVSKHPEEFGKGSPEGVIAPEAANNSMVGGSLIPTFALGIPANGTTAILMGAMMMVGLRPGPQLFVQSMPLLQTLSVYLLIGCALMVVIGGLGANLFYRLTLVPLNLLVPGVVVIAAIGAFASRGEAFDLWVMFGFGLVSYFLAKWKYPLSALCLGFVLVPTAETYFTQSMAFSNWNFTVFFTRPISLVLWALIAASLVSSVLLYRKFRADAERASAAENAPGR